VIQLTLIVKMTNAAQIVEMSVTVNNNSPIQDYVHPDDQTEPTFEMIPGFKPSTLTWVLSSSRVQFILCKAACSVLFKKIFFPLYK